MGNFFEKKLVEKKGKKKFIRKKIVGKGKKKLSEKKED